MVKKSKLKITEEALAEVTSKVDSIDPNDPLFKEFVAGGALTSKPIEEEKEEEKVKMSFYIPASINKQIEAILRKRKIKISKQHWVLNAIFRELKIKSD